MARCDHPLKFKRGVILSLPFEARLMRLEVGDLTPDLSRSYPYQFTDGIWLGSTTLCGIIGSTWSSLANVFVSSMSV